MSRPTRGGTLLEHIAEGIGILIAITVFFILVPVYAAMTARRAWLRGRTWWGYLSLAAGLLYLAGTGMTVAPDNHDLRLALLAISLVLLGACTLSVRSAK